MTKKYHTETSKLASSAKDVPEYCFLTHRNIFAYIEIGGYIYIYIYIIQGTYLNFIFTESSLYWRCILFALRHVSRRHLLLYIYKMQFCTLISLRKFQQTIYYI